MNKIPLSIRKKLDDKALEIDPKFKASLKNQLFNKEIEMAKQSKSNVSSLNQFFKQNNAVPLLAVFVALVLVGGTSALITNNRAEQARLSEIEISDEELADVLSVNDLRAIAERDEPSLSIVSIELENEDEGLLYKVKYSDGSVRYYLASDGSSVVRNTENVETDESVPAGFQAGITLSEARNIALAQRPGKTITKIELETENGVVVYSVRFSDDGRVDINATNGSVVRVRNGNDSSQESDSDDSKSETGEDSSDSGSDDSQEDEDEKEDDKDDDKVDNSGSGSHSDDD